MLDVTQSCYISNYIKVRFRLDLNQLRKDGEER